jgi:RNA-directed DNA polymerase
LVGRHARQRGTPLFYLKMDVQNFFATIDLKVLYRLLDRHLENDLYLWLCRVVIFHRATKKGAFVLTSPKSLWRMLPKYKSMFYAPDDVGLPIGNLTSQFFANIYMDHFDQYV